MTEKQSRTGRRRYRTHSEAEQLAAEFEGSELTRQEFCDRNDVSLNSLTRYLKKHRTARAVCGELVAVEVTSASSTNSELSVLLPGGRRVEVRRGFDAATLRQLVAVLERC